jgi:hypothetical protein
MKVAASLLPGMRTKRRPAPVGREAGLGAAAARHRTPRRLIAVRA